MAPSVMPRLPRNWASQWAKEGSMSMFIAEDGDFYRIYVVHKESLNVHHVMDFPDHNEEYGYLGYWPSCAFMDGKLYLVGDRHPKDVHICDLTLPQPCYVWKQGPPMHSTKHMVHLVPLNGKIFAISNPDDLNMARPFNRDDVVVSDPDKPIVASFEVWDTTSSRSEWDVLPDPPFPDYNNQQRQHEVMSCAVHNGLILFVFDNVGKHHDYDHEEDTDNPIIWTQVKAFDPRLMQWVNDVDVPDDIRSYMNLCAHRTQGGERILEFKDPSLRCFFMDPPGPGLFSIPPCFCTYDRSSFDAESLQQALIEFIPSSFEKMTAHQFLQWFQCYMRPYSSPIRGLSTLTKGFAFEHKRHHRCFILPSYHQDATQGANWIIYLVGFVHRACVVSRFQLVPSGYVSGLFEAKDLQMHRQELTNMSNANSENNTILPKFYRVAGA